MGFTIRVAFYALVAAEAFACVGAAAPAHAEVTETVLWSFSGGSDGSQPFAPVIVDKSGALYGTATSGGAVNSPLCFGIGCGTVFKLKPIADDQPAKFETTLASFSGGSDGGGPVGGLFAPDQSPSANKTLYGTTGFEPAFGTVFKLTGGALSTLWRFSGGDDGGNPLAALIANQETGALYGTTASGGINNPAVCFAVNAGCGTVFKIDAIDQTLTTIWSFTGGNDGATPVSGPLIADETGALYGTTGSGGINNPTICVAISIGCGTVFKLTPPALGQTTWTLATLWSFTGGKDGGNPQAGLIADKTGALYGTASVGGSTPSGCGGFGCGVVFRLTPPAAGQTAWTFATVWSFSGSDGGFPASTLIADKTGALYGTTEFGGIGAGNVFKLTPPSAGQTDWSLTTLWNFSGGSDGSVPIPGLIADKKGALYGTTQFGGDLTAPSCPGFGCGVVFKLTGTGFATEDDD
jgi:hypothetical protein